MFDDWFEGDFTRWLAGFFDGEGCIYLPKRSGIALNISNTCEDVIRSIHDSLGIGVVITSTFDNPKWKTRFSWECRRYDEAKIVLDRLYPYLTIKKAKADVALARIRASMDRTQAKLERSQAILDAINTGEHYQVIADRFGVSYTAVNSLACFYRNRSKVTYRRQPPQRSLSSHVTHMKTKVIVLAKQVDRNRSTGLESLRPADVVVNLRKGGKGGTHLRRRAKKPPLA